MGELESNYAVAIDENEKDIERQKKVVVEGKSKVKSAVKKINAMKMVKKMRPQTTTGKR